MANIKLLDLLQETLTKAKADYLDKGRIDRTTFEEFNTVDTTANKAYIEKMCQFYVKYEISKEDIIDMFTRVIDSKEENPTKHKELKNDIFNIIKSKKDFDNFKDKVLDFKFKIPNIQQYKNSDNAELVYEDNRFVIFRVLNFEGACEIGRGTDWCHSNRNNQTSYDVYKNKTNYMFFDNSYPKSNPKSGFALSVDQKGNITELKSKDQTYNDKEYISYPISYLTDNLGLDLKLFKYIKPSILSDINEFRDGLTLDIIKDKFSWLLEDSVNIKDVIIGYSDSTLIWYEGTWISGTWKYGIWKNGWFVGDDYDGAQVNDSIWEDGIFEGGYFDGIWKGGKWKSGEFSRDGIWLDKNNPRPSNVKEYKDGLTYEIIKEKFPWLLEDEVNFNDAVVGYSGNKLIWYSGNWDTGIWEDGIWKNGTFYGIWEDGIFEGGEFVGKWKGGKWKGGEFSKFAEWEDPNNPDPRNT